MRSRLVIIAVLVALLAGGCGDDDDGAGGATTTTTTAASAAAAGDVCDRLEAIGEANEETTQAIASGGQDWPETQEIVVSGSERLAEQYDALAEDGPADLRAAFADLADFSRQQAEVAAEAESPEDLVVAMEELPFASDSLDAIDELFRSECEGAGGG